jgi:hypothetical protein
MGSDLELSGFELATAYLASHGRPLGDHGIKALALSPRKAAEFIDVLERHEVPLRCFEVWLYYVEERGRRTQGPHWVSHTPPYVSYQSAREALGTATQSASDLVTFKFGGPRA